MKVKVYAPAWISHERIDDDGLVVLDEGSTLKDLYRVLKVPIPLRLSVFCSLNSEPAGPNTRLNDQDTVSFIFPLVGG